MKKIKQIRGEFDLITEAEQNEERKLIALIRSGLLDVSKLPILKRAMSKDTKVLTPAERNALLELMNALMTQVLTNNAVYTKVRHNVMAEDVASLNKAREVEVQKSPTSMATMPSILVLKRKAIRVYPGGQNVGLYYSQQLDKYVAVPFSGKDNNILSMNEEVEELDEVSVRTMRRATAKRMSQVPAVKNTKELNTLSATNQTKAKKAARMGAMMAKKIAKRRGPEDAAKEVGRTVDLAVRYKQAKKRKAVQFADKVKDEREKKVANDKSMRGTGSIGGDILHHGTDSAASMIGHVIGKALYRRKNPKPMTEQEVDEGLASFASGVMAKAKSGFQKFAAGAAAKEGGGGGKPAREKKYVRTDQQSKLRIRASGVNDDRDRRVQKSAAHQPLASQSRSVQETTEIQLDGNTFLLNTGVANKVVAMYQTLNEENRRKMVEKMSESDESLNKVITFAVRH
jgi:hypothetical protein